MKKTVAIIAAVTATVANASALGAPNPVVPSSTCATLAAEAASLQKEQLTFFSQPMTDPLAIGRTMERLGRRAAAIQTKQEANKCAGATIDNKSLGK